MESWLADIRHALRWMRRNLGFTAVAALTLALGIGANSAIFSLVNATLIRPLPFRQPERLVQLFNKYDRYQLPRATLSAPDLVDLTERNRVFDGVAAAASADLNLTGDGEPVRLRIARTTASLFPVLGVTPKLGRVFTSEDDTPGREHVVLLSHGLWKRRFGADPAIVGRDLLLDGTRYQVLGVMPEGFGFPTSAVELWTPLALTSAQKSDQNRGMEWLVGIARLKPGATLAMAQADVHRIAEEVMGPGPGYFRDNGWGHVASLLKEDAVGSLRSPLLLLLGAVGFVLLIACGNVAHLLIARTAVRRREIAVRTALGAGRLRLARQFLTESVLLALIGGALGLLFGVWGAELLGRLQIAGLPTIEHLGLDWGVVWFTLGLSTLTGLLLGTAPALHAQSGPLAQALKEATSASVGGRPRTRLRNVLVAAEVALTVMLLAGAGLAIRSLGEILAVKPGFETQNVLTLRTSLPSSAYADGARQAAFFERACAALATRPGVKAAGAVLALPLTGMVSTRGFSVEGAAPPANAPPLLCNFRVVAGDYFRAMGIPIVRGRRLAPPSAQDTVGEILVDEQLARRIFPGQDPIGRRLVFGEQFVVPIVGVVGSVKEEGLEAESRLGVYASVGAVPVPSMAFAVKTDAITPARVDDVRRTVWSLDRNLPVFDVAPLEQVVSTSVATPRGRALLLGLFAALALVLAAVGIYGVVSYGVAQRTHEIGVRIALGARPEDVMQLVVGQGMRPVFLGLAIGLAGALAGSRLLASQLYGVSPTDPITFIVVPALLAGVALIASAAPAWRAARLDPLTALRQE